MYPRKIEKWDWKEKDKNSSFRHTQPNRPGFCAEVLTYLMDKKLPETRLRGEAVRNARRAGCL